MGVESRAEIGCIRVVGTDRHGFGGPNPASQVRWNAEHGVGRRDHGGALPWGGSRLIQRSVPVLPDGQGSACGGDDSAAGESSRDGAVRGPAAWPTGFAMCAGGPGGKDSRAHSNTPCGPSSVKRAVEDVK